MILETALIARSDSARPLWLTTEGDLPMWIAAQPEAVARWVRAHAFRAERHHVLALPDAAGGIHGAVAGLGALRTLDEVTVWHAAALPDRLPGGDYTLATALAPATATRFALGWLLGAYRLARYRSAPPTRSASLVAPSTADLTYVEAAARSTALARDLINAPANELGPAELAEAALALAARCSAHCEVLGPAELEARDYPLIRAVGAGSPREPRLVDLRWGDPAAPRVTLVGKGVCFDSGGLDLKPSAAMLLMKKDMGGAACALALASLLMTLEAPVRLRVLVPCVENSIDGRSYRPGDVLRSRKGLTVEIGNTDAEGRLVLADALTEADTERPDLLVDLATLTGAARTALGPELPAAYSPDAALLAQLQALAEAETDPVWPMPLWPGYEDELASKIADLGNVSASPFAGSVVAALFLKRFVTATPAWLHLDLYAWNPKERPGRPVGAEAQCVRALYRLVRARFG
ncbi:MAG TPA: leucyl aminopeptidase family protein [Steroidobacteraceae bacterium]|nr:leucyl aminopeptidase family protein [Steroidobacteraceae bacterium]